MVLRGIAVDFSKTRKIALVEGKKRVTLYFNSSTDDTLHLVAGSKRRFRVREENFILYRNIPKAFPYLPSISKLQFYECKDMCCTLVFHLTGGNALDTVKIETTAGLQELGLYGEKSVLFGTPSK